MNINQTKIIDARTLNSWLQCKGIPNDFVQNTHSTPSRINPESQIIIDSQLPLIEDGVINKEKPAIKKPFEIISRIGILDYVNYRDKEDNTSRSSA